MSQDVGHHQSRLWPHVTEEATSLSAVDCSTLWVTTGMWGSLGIHSTYKSTLHKHCTEVGEQGVPTPWRGGQRSCPREVSPELGFEG